MKIKKKYLKYIYSEYPQLTLINNKFKILINNSDIPIFSNEIYEYGYQIKKFNTSETETETETETKTETDKLSNKFYYIKFYDWCTFDIDNTTLKEINKLLNKIISLTDRYVFALYKTNKGFHVHIMNKKIEYNSSEYKILSKMLGNDIWYYNYTKMIGYKIRLSKKSKDDFISEFVNYYIPNNLINNNYECNYYKSIYDNYLLKFKI